MTTGEPDGAMRFCCLGVLEDIVHRATRNEFWTYERRTQSFLTHDTAQLCGLDEDPRVVDPIDTTMTSSLAELNDSGTSFARIADLIEEQL